MRKCFRVDWTDHAYPEIVECHPTSDEAKTLTECKREVLEAARNLINHWRGVAKRAADLKLTDFCIQSHRTI